MDLNLRAKPFLKPSLALALQLAGHEGLGMGDIGKVTHPQRHFFRQQRRDRHEQRGEGESKSDDQFHREEWIKSRLGRWAIAACR
ncbi:MAG: hypothetical protein V4710_16230 [Verrucomicrobiota bacterium]